MSWGFVAVGVGTVAASYINSQSSKNAAKSQTKAADQGNQMQWNMYQQQRSDNMPWLQAGSNALSQLQNNNIFGSSERYLDKDGNEHIRQVNGNFEADPGYQFRLQEGNKAINNAAAARGMANSGATMKALTEYGQNLASSEYNNVYNRNYNRLSALAGFGQGANNQNNAASSNYANAYNQNTLAAGNANAASQMAQSNNIQNMVNTGANMWAIDRFSKKG